MLFWTWLLLLNSVFGFPLVSEKAFLQNLKKEIFDSRWSKDTGYFPEFAYPPISWSTQEGLYPSFVHLNFHGNDIAALGRNKYNFPDSNGFVSMFMVEILLEAKRLGTANISDHDLEASLRAIASHRDKNSNGPIYHFWNQKEVEGQWIASIPNIDVPISSFKNGMEMISSGLEKLGLAPLATKVQGLGWMVHGLSKMFSIPADSDDTGCHLAMGSKLKNFEDLAYSSRVWDRRNKDPNGSLFHYFKKYAYAPFQTENEDAATIDPRTYFWMHDFLQQVSTKEYESLPIPRSANGLPDLRIITTWMQHTSEIDGQQPGKMPFNVNNVDASVVANALYGLVSHSSDYGLKWWDQEMETIFIGSVRLLDWTLRENVMANRPDLLLLYYPPVYDYYWFVARLNKLLGSRKVKQLNNSVFNQANELLSESLKEFGSLQLLKKSKSQDSFVFWDDFLGNSDTDAFGKPKPKYEDRLFSTAVAVNALIDIWTDEDMVFDPLTSQTIRNSIRKSVDFLVKKYNDYPKENAFFSGSIKGLDSLPFYYPANVYRNRNGTSASCSERPTESSSGLLVAVQGIMESSEFLEKSSGECFGKKVPVQFEGYNCGSCVFPFWSSPSLTTGVVFLAVSKFSVLV